jgi:hypothetical protein
VITIGGRTACSHGNWDILAPTWRADLREFVIQEMRRGYSMAAIADTLNRERVPPLGGGEGWRASSVQSLHRTASNGRLGARA